MGNKFFRPVNLSLFRTARIGSIHLFDEDYKEAFRCELGAFLTHKAPLVERLCRVGPAEICFVLERSVQNK